MPNVITAIEVQQKRKDRVNVYLDDKYAFSLNTMVAERAGLKKGLVVTERDIAELVGDDAYQKALDSALNFLSFRPRAEKEVRQNLYRKKVQPDTLDRVIERLKELKLIDDKAFAEYWQDNRQQFSPRGPRAIKAELRAKGLSAAVIDETVDSESNQEELAYNAGLKKARALCKLDYREFRRRLGDYLLRRGFSYDTISTVSKRLWQEEAGDSQVSLTDISDVEDVDDIGSC
jgi:regulatory protein